MAIFQFVKGPQIKNATGYVLGKRHPTDNKTEENIHPIGHKDVQQKLEIVGAIGAGGVPAEKVENMVSGVTVSGGASPVTRLGDNGYEYYYRIDGILDVVITPPGNGTQLPLPDRIQGVPFNTIVKVPDEGLRYYKIDWNSPLSVPIGKNEIYLNISFGASLSTPEITRVKIYDASALPSGTLISNVSLGKIEGYDTPSVRVSGADGNYRRSDYIPLDCLTNDLKNGDEYACFGVISAPNDYAAPYYKIAFYNSDLSFRTGVTYSDLLDKFHDEDGNYTKPYLTVEDIKQFTISSSEPIYVMFCSEYNPGAVDISGWGTRDVVSVGGFYFPLLEPHVSMAKGTEYEVDALNDGDYLFAQSTADGVFFKTSIWSAESESLRYHSTPKNT